MLYIVSTPIGNLEDMTHRAVRILKEVDYIAAEDTRHSRILLDHYEIKTPMVSFHSHSGRAKVDKIIDMLSNGKDVALISDAGTPGISDPGYVLIRAALDAGFEVSPIPGPTALCAALVVSGLPMDKFLYLGFLPLKKGRQTLFTSLKDEKRTVVFYESPHRIMKTLGQLREVLGDERPVAVCKELTKKFERVFRGTLGSVVEEMEQASTKGEWVVVLGS
jgi:16S rRNA (cytidine1402-2'-O)-methyltransferase